MDEMVSDSSQVRIDEDAEGARLRVRPGVHAAHEIVVAAVFGAVIVALCALSGKVVLALAIVVALYFTTSAALAYLRSGIWIYEREVRVAAAVATNWAGRDDISGIGVLRISKIALLGREKRQLALLLKSGQWYLATGVSGDPATVHTAAEKVAEVTGWPIATSAIPGQAKDELPGW